MQIWLSLALVVLTGHKPSPLFLVVGWVGTFIAVFSNFSYAFSELHQDDFSWLVFSPHASPFGKRGIASYLPPCLRGWDIHAPCPPFPPKQTHVLPWSAVLCAVTTRVRDVQYLQGAPSQSFTKVQKWDRVNGFISDLEALTNQAVPDSSGRQAVGFFERQI